jgi:hypothetical protein
MFFFHFCSLPSSYNVSTIMRENYILLVKSAFSFTFCHYFKQCSRWYACPHALHSSKWTTDVLQLFDHFFVISIPDLDKDSLFCTYYQKTEQKFVALSCYDITWSDGTIFPVLPLSLYHLYNMWHQITLRLNYLNKSAIDH